MGIENEIIKICLLTTDKMIFILIGLHTQGKANYF